MIRILHLNPKINLTCGISKIIYLIATNIEENYLTHVFCLGGDGIEKFRKAKINITVLSIPKGRIIQSFRIFIKLFSIVRKQKIDIIHSHHRYFDLLAYIISKFISVKTITSVHNKVYGKKFLSYKSEQLIACSNSIKEHLIKQFDISPNKIKVIHNFVDPEEVLITKEKAVLKKELGIDNYSIIIGFIGRFSIREKGVDILLNSFQKLSIEYNNLVLIMIGEGEDMDFILNYNVSDNLNIIVLEPQGNIFDYYNIIDIIVLPSRIEPFGIVAIESGLMKKPLIASDVDGLKEIIDNEINGLLFSNDDEKMFLDRLNLLLSDTNLGHKIGEELFIKVIKNFTKKQIIPEYLQLYEKMLR